MEWYPCSYSGGNLDSLLDTHGVSPEAQTFAAGRGLPFSGSVDSPGTASMSEFAMSHKSGFYTILLNNVWYNLLSLRHRNGYGDGSGYGIFFYSRMLGKLTIDIDLAWRQQTGADSWGLEKILLDSNNYKKLAFDIEHGNEINLAGNLASIDTDYAWINYRDKITDAGTSKPIEKYILGNGAAGRAALECKYLAINDRPGDVSLADTTFLVSWLNGVFKSVNRADFVQAKMANGFYGMCFGNYQDDGWIRTTQQGILPYQSGGILSGHCQLGAEDWYFSKSYIDTMFANLLKIRNNIVSSYTANSYIGFESGGNVVTINSLNAIKIASDGNPGTITFGVYTHDKSYKRWINYKGLSSDNNNAYFMPSVDGTSCLGYSSYRWRQIYAQTSTISTSDLREKKKISYIGLRSNEDTYMSDDTLQSFIRGLLPCIYLRIDGDTGRPHHGLISQDVEELLKKLGIKDHAGFIKSPKTETIEIEEEVEEEYVDEADGQTKTRTVIQKNEEQREIPGEYVYGLRYEEFIADIVRFVQIQDEKIEEQERKINSLEGRLSALEDMLNASTG